MSPRAAEPSAACRALSDDSSCRSTRAWQSCSAPRPDWSEAIVSRAVLPTLAAASATDSAAADALSSAGGVASSLVGLAAGAAAPTEVPVSSPSWALSRRPIMPRPAPSREPTCLGKPRPHLRARPRVGT